MALNVARGSALKSGRRESNAAIDSRPLCIPPAHRVFRDNLSQAEGQPHRDILNRVGPSTCHSDAPLPCSEACVPDSGAQREAGGRKDNSSRFNVFIKVDTIEASFYSRRRSVADVYLKCLNVPSITSVKARLWGRHFNVFVPTPLISAAGGNLCGPTTDVTAAPSTKSQWDFSIWFGFIAENKLRGKNKPLYDTDKFYSAKSFS